MKNVKPHQHLTQPLFSICSQLVFISNPNPIYLTVPPLDTSGPIGLHQVAHPLLHKATGQSCETNHIPIICQVREHPLNDPPTALGLNLAR